MNLKRTPLYEKHVSLKAKIIDFGGWAMPVQYTNVIDEHKSTRTNASIFDICHMGEIKIKGPQALAFLQYCLTRNLADQETGQIKLSTLLNCKGGIIDDLTVYKTDENAYILVTNAATRERDYQWLKEIQQNKNYDCLIKDISDTTGKIDLQGPCSEEILQNISSTDLKNVSYYHFVQSKIMDTKATISRSGYTGEDGFEIYAPASQINLIWDKLMETGRPFGLKPAGLGARDTLRLEAGMMLNGQDITEDISPLEVPYGWLIDWNKDFVGKSALEVLKKNGPAKKLGGFEMINRGIARHGYKIFSGKKEIGIVTSGTFAPSLNKAIGLAFLDKNFSLPDTVIDVAIRESISQAKVVKLPFYKRQK